MIKLKYTLIKEVHQDITDYNVNIYGLEITFGNTIGNMLRRLLMTKLPGIAIKYFQITGLKHEFDYAHYLDKDADQITYILRDIHICYDTSIPLEITTSLTGPREIYARDILPNVPLLYPDEVIFYITSNVTIDITITLHRGQGFIPYYKHTPAIGMIPTTSIFTRIQDVNFRTETSNIDENFETLTLEFKIPNLYNEDFEPIRYVLDELSHMIDNILDAINNKDVETCEVEKEDETQKQIEIIINKAQTELIAYIYESMAHQKSLPDLIQFLKDIPDKTCVNKIKIKKKEIQNTIKQLTKLLKQTKIQNNETQ